MIPRLDRSGTVEGADHEWLDAGFALPRDGVELPVVARGDEVARLVLLAGPDTPASLDRARSSRSRWPTSWVRAMAAADQDEIAALPIGPDRQP